MTCSYWRTKDESGTTPEATLCAVRRALAIVSVCLAAALGACGDDDEPKSDSSTAAPSEAAPATPAPTETQTDTEAATTCEQVDAPAGGERTAKEPKGGLDKGKSYSLVVVTNCGTFTIALDPKVAPKASASLVSLAEQKFFDGTVFHRIVPGFVIQGGDPTGTGTGGPGYSTVDEPPADATYPKGAVAMAKAGTEPPGTAGSQFFVMTGDRGLPPEYALVGKVTDGLVVVEKIGALGDASEQPTETVLIEKVTVKES
jgi:peptidyl-prolyl cis-trans isomerase B (cyclophilin B)